MALPYASAPTTRRTPQTKAIPGREPEMARNDAGGFTFVLSPRDQVERFLILGSESGSYYVGKEVQIERNASALLQAIAADGVDVVNMITDVSVRGRAPKNEPAVYALAQVFVNGNLEAKKAAEAALPAVLRTGTDILHFTAYIQAFGSWNKVLRRAVGNWYTGKEVGKLAYQLAKYQQRDGMSHLDVLRLAHPKSLPENRDYNDLINWVKGKEVETSDRPGFEILEGMSLIKAATPKQAPRLIRKFGLTHEMIPTELKNDLGVWEALLEKMPLNAMVRNLGKMSQLGLLAPMSSATALVTQRLSDEDYIHRSRLHPLAILVALKVYAQGHGMAHAGRTKDVLSWDTNQNVVDALDAAFYLAFENVTPSNRPVVLALDLSGSMAQAQIANMPLTAREAVAAMALVTASVEPNYHILGFTNGLGRAPRTMDEARNHTGLTDLGISPRMRLDTVVKKLEKEAWGGTDCSLPMQWALDKGIKDIGAFVVYTDNDTWAGHKHPVQALQEYRRKLGQRAKLAVVATLASPFTIADPKDVGMMDFVGFDTAAPAVLSDFIAK